MWYNTAMQVEEIKRKAGPILKRRAIRRAALFGSTARGEVSARDVDMLVEMPRPYGLFAFLALKGELEDALDKKVDLIEYSAIKAPLRERILRDEVRIL
jgi:predicted nucleotidyltransferase